MPGTVPGTVSGTVSGTVPGARGLALGKVRVYFSDASDGSAGTCKTPSRGGCGFFPRLTPKAAFSPAAERLRSSPPPSPAHSQAGMRRLPKKMGDLEELEGARVAEPKVCQREKRVQGGSDGAEQEELRVLGGKMQPQHKVVEGRVPVLLFAHRK